MKIKTKHYSFPYSVADTEYGPTITWECFNLTLEFCSFQNEHCKLIFEEVSHFEFLSEDEMDTKLFSYDGVVEVIDSEVIDKLVSVGEIDKSDISRFKHIVIGFNEIGSYLSIVFRAMVDKSSTKQ